MSSTALPRTGPRPWYVAGVSGMASYIDSTAIVSSEQGRVDATVQQVCVDELPVAILAPRIGLAAVDLRQHPAVGLNTGRQRVAR